MTASSPGDVWKPRVPELETAGHVNLKYKLQVQRMEARKQNKTTQALQAAGKSKHNEAPTLVIRKMSAKSSHFPNYNL